mgnify:CR=1 FL=1
MHSHDSSHEVLTQAVLRFAVDLMVQRGFTAVDPPLLVRDAAMFGTGFFPGGEEQTYRCEKDGLNLIGTYVDFVGADLRLPAALLVILVVLLLKPGGLFGKPQVKKV